MNKIVSPGKPTYIIFPPGNVPAEVVQEFRDLWQEAVSTGKPIVLWPGWRVHDIAAGKTYEGYPPGWAEPQMLTAEITSPDWFDRGFLIGAVVVVFSVVLGYIAGAGL